MLFGNIENGYIECIKIDCLEGEDKLFIVVFLFRSLTHCSHNKDIGIINLKLVLQFNKEVIVIWIFFLEPNNEESKFSFVPICHYIECLVFIIIHNLLDSLNLKMLVKVNTLFELSTSKLILLCIPSFGRVENSFLISWNDSVFLRIVQSKILWLSLQWYIKFDNCFDNICFIIKFNNLIWFSKQQSAREFTIWCSFKIELHAEINQLWNFKNDNSLMLLKQFFSFPFASLEDMNLLWPLCILDQMLSCKYS